MNEEIEKRIHDLSNKLMLLDGKIKKSQSLCHEENVKIELDKACKNFDAALILLNQLKAYLSEKSFKAK